MIIETTAEHKDKLLSIIKSSGQFDDSGLEYVKQTLEDHLAQSSDALWYTAFDREPVGVAYCSPEPVTSGTWNLLMLWIESGFEGNGYGSALVSKIENVLSEKEARLLIVETSSLDEFSTARSFYEKLDFKLEATISSFFDAGDDKLVYTKNLI